MMRNPATAMTTESSVRGMLRKAMRMNENTRVVDAVTRDPMHWFIDVPSVSTSLVTRLITSPFDDLSKYLSGMRFIFLEMSLRNICAERCDTVAIM